MENVPFPPELRDLIIDHIHDDRATLKAASLTSRSWLPRARYHIFRRTKIAPGPCADNFRRLLSSVPDVGKYVQDVEICGTKADDWLAADGNTRDVLVGRWPTLQQRQTVSNQLDLIAWLETVLPAPGTFSRAVTLTLTNMPISGTVGDILAPHFANVNTLVWNGCQGLTFNDYVEFRRAFRHCDAIHMLDARWMPHSGIPAGQKSDRSRAKVTTLVLSRKIDIVTLVNWFILHDRYKSIKNLSCFVTSSANARSLKDLFEAMGPGLEDLHITISDVRDPTDLLKTTDFHLQANTGLRRLKIDCCRNDLSFMTQVSFSWILLLLSKVNSSVLRQIRISILRQDLLSINYEGLSVVLSSTRFENLQRLTFEVETRPGDCEKPEIEKVRSRLSSLSLQIDFTTYHR
ncbi:hypothetical protein C8Q75DRAFT_724813 [Abortiporus biennis]|nr:hypothetical protein C8Q75DRAFT_724813 [Abortiporus biennis]